MDQAGQLTIDEATKKRLLNLSEISLWLDTYDDIFSDFDPRPYSQRALSDDFIMEAKKASRDKTSGSIELNLLIPTKLRDLHSENLIKKRLKEHFKKHYHSHLNDRKKIINSGFKFVGLGIVTMLVTTYILHQMPDDEFIWSFLVVLFEPAGWFLFWEGMNQVIFESKTVSPDLEFYEKMSKCEINFLEY